MSELTSTTPSTSCKGGDTVQGVSVMPEAVLKVTDFEGDYERDDDNFGDDYYRMYVKWSRVREEVQGVQEGGCWN